MNNTIQELQLIKRTAIMNAQREPRGCTEEEADRMTPNVVNAVVFTAVLNGLLYDFEDALKADRTMNDTVKKMLYIGIDPGAHTGVAIWSRTERMLYMVDTMTITQALKTVDDYVGAFDNDGNKLYEVVVYIEDARKRTWFGESGREQLQGAGSVKRDCSIWETFCEELGVECRKIAPRHNTTKLTASQFKVLTGWQGRTSEHSRDAACLVFGR